MPLCIFNTHTLRTREVIIVPNDKWGGSGLLGCTIRFDVLHRYPALRMCLRAPGGS
jgi:hypothetical protein